MSLGPGGEGGLKAMGQNSHSGGWVKVLPDREALSVHLLAPVHEEQAARDCLGD